MYTFVRTVASRAVLALRLPSSCRMAGAGSWDILGIRELFLACLGRRGLEIQWAAEKQCGI